MPAIAKQRPRASGKPKSKTIAPASLTTVKVSATKGRPMLQWIGKHPIRAITAFPAQLTETFDPIKTGQPGGLLYHGDNKEVLAHLLASGLRGQINLIYIDPPFNAGVDYVRKVTLRGVKMEKLEGESYSFTEQVQYSNNWHVDAYLQFLYERLLVGKELLAADGIIFIRMDVHFGSYLRAIADEVFGPAQFQNEIIVNRIKKNVTEKGRRTIPNAVDYLYVYFKTGDAEYKDVLRGLPEKRPGYWHNMDSQGVPGPRSLTLGGKTYYPSPGCHLKFPQAQADEMWANKKIRENPKSGALEYWVEEKDYENLDSDWTDIPGYAFSTGYPTENSEPLLERVIKAGSRPGDLVVDYFIGSGTTAAVAQRLGRRWIGVDINKGSIQTTSKRLQEIINQETASRETGESPELLPSDKSISPVNYTFQIYRVNDYDLQIQHNEAVALACEHVGVERTKADAFFDGLQGKRLVKVIPFTHPLSPTDLEEIKTELKARKNEERDILVICLGKELTCDAWLTEWNRLRRKGDVPNKIEVIELRTDPKYGKFIAHKPATARVSIKRSGAELKIDIEDFISPTILERLETQSGVLKGKIEDWRSMVDSVMIDPAFDGEVFNIALTDLPERKSDFVSGSYTLPAPKKETMVAVKITDMLGEEVVVQKSV